MNNGSIDFPADSEPWGGELYWRNGFEEGSIRFDKVKRFDLPDGSIRLEYLFKTKRVATTKIGGGFDSVTFDLQSYVDAVREFV